MENNRNENTIEKIEKSEPKNQGDVKKYSVPNNQGTLKTKDAEINKEEKNKN